MITLLFAAMLAAAPQSDAGSAGMQRELGKALFKQGKLDEAIERFQAAVKLNPQDAVAWYNLAYASRKRQKFDQAAEAYQRYTALSPEDPDGYFGLAESLRSAGRPKDALAAYTTYISKEKRPTEQKWVEQAKQRISEIERAPDPAALQAEALTRGDAAFAAKDYRAAVFAYQDAILAAPGNVEALVKAGQAYARLGHDDEAMAQWTKALQLDPQNVPAREGLAAIQERRVSQGTLAPPLTTVDEASARAHYTKAVGLVRDRQYDAGAAELDQALALKPGFAVALVARGSARIGQGRYQDAIVDYTAAQKADPSLAAPLFGLAEAWRALGQGEKAAALYRQFAASAAPDAQQSLKDYALQNAQALSPQ